MASFWITPHLIARVYVSGNNSGIMQKQVLYNNSGIMQMPFQVLRFSF